MSDILLGDSDYNEKFDVLEGERLFKFVDETTEGQSNISDARYGNHVVKESNHGACDQVQKVPEFPLQLRVQSHICIPYAVTNYYNIPNPIRL